MSGLLLPSASNGEANHCVASISEPKLLMRASTLNQSRIVNITGAAIVCSHVAEDGYPILLAIRDEPLDRDDSGWQFLCNSGETEDEGLAQVWALGEVLEAEATLKNIISQPPGSRFERNDTNSPWIAVKS